MATARWYVAHSIDPADSSAVQNIPNPGSYTDLNDGDYCLLEHNNNLLLLKYSTTATDTDDPPYVVTPTGVTGAGRWLLLDNNLGAENGFPLDRGDYDNTISTLEFDDSTRTFTTSPVSGDYVIVVNSVPVLISGSKSVVIPDSEGQHWIYFDKDGELHSIYNPDTHDIDDLIENYCLVAMLYWDATNKKALDIGNEKHGRRMSSTTHLYLHRSFGAVYRTGLDPINFSIDGDGSLGSCSICCYRWCNN